jgi:uncharacterized protein (TIGR02611 family)
VRIFTVVAGFALLGVGVVLLPLPGPGWLVIFAALAILAREFSWARSLLDWLKDRVRRFRGRDGSARNGRQP